MFVTHANSAPPLAHGCALLPSVGVWAISLYGAQTRAAVTPPNSIQLSTHHAHAKHATRTQHGSHVGPAAGYGVPPGNNIKMNIMFQQLCRLDLNSN